MPREKLMANYLGEMGEHYMGIPACDLYETQWNALSDEQKALVGESAFYRVRPAAEEDVEAAAKHVEKAEPVNPMAEQAKAEMPAPPAPKDEPKPAPKAEAKK
jgi:hypothetical protein